MVTYETGLDERVATISTERRRELASRQSGAFISAIPFVDRYGFSGYDVLWFGLAIFAAFRIGRGE